MKTMIGSAVTAAIMLAALPAARAMMFATGVHGENAPQIREARRGRGADDPVGHG